MSDQKPLIIAVAPNGARYGQKDHPALPISPAELAITAAECLQEGARMIHLHVRDKAGQHSLAPEHYRPALKAVKEAVGDEMIIQVTSESAGLFNTDQQINMMQQLMPECMSLALREFVQGEIAPKSVRKFLHKLSENGCLMQYILYDETDFNLYRRLLDSGDITDTNHSLLFVLGRYTKQAPTVEIIKQYLPILSFDAPWMVCTFGKHGHQILSNAAELGCQLRVGFENGFFLPDGTIANSNAELVKRTAQSLSLSGRKLATIEQTRIHFGQPTKAINKLSSKSV